MNKIDIKSEAGVLKEYDVERIQLAKVKALTIHDVKKEKGSDFVMPEIRSDERARGVSLANPDYSQVRRVSDYYYALDHIKKICKERGVEFKDITVVIGPLDKIFGPGTLGGFMGPKQFSDSKLKIPHEIEKGLFVSPPIIAINSTRMPTYPQQTFTLVHEYSHHLFSITNPDYEHQYHKDPTLRKRDELKWWGLYFSDEDEIRAHIEEIKLQLKSGQSIDEVLREKIGGATNDDAAIDSRTYKINYPIALKFRELVYEAARELEKEEELNEKPVGPNTGIGNSNTPITQN